jgi:hypothetical protein
MPQKCPKKIHLWRKKNGATNLAIRHKKECHDHRFRFLINPGNIILTCGEEESEEKFILMLRTPHDAERASVGDRGVISFKPGGPTGGY